MNHPIKNTTINNRHKMPSVFKISHLSHACLFLLALQNANAQTTPSAADVLRSIEQYRPEQNKFPTRTPTNKAPFTGEKLQVINKLSHVIVHSPLYTGELSKFWANEIGNSISSEKQNEFNAFAWELFQRKGYLPYITSKVESSPTGSTLNIYVNFPKIRDISVVPTDGKNNDNFTNEVMRRFTTAYPSGMPVDVQGFENQLNAIAYDLPVDLEVSLRQVNETQLDVIIHLSPAEHLPGKVLGGFVQSNNYGLSQFGKAQLLGNVRLNGLTPQSELTLTTQQSQGVGYYRADYEMPLRGSGARIRAYGATVNNHANNSKGASQEAGAGITQLLRTDRIGRWLASAELSQRKTQNWASEILTSEHIDNQLRFKLRTESSNGWVDNFSNEFVMLVGDVNLDRVAADKSADSASTTGLNIAGTYKKFEVNGALSNSLDTQRIYTGSIRWKMQAASKNLDGYNRISLGGIHGIRAFSSLDGVGDQGAQISFDITHQIVPDVWGGLFYDVGIVKNNHSPLINATDAGYYTLQGAGWQVGGKIEQINWNLSTAFAIGKTPGPGVWTPTNTQAGDFRVNFSLTYAF